MMIDDSTNASVFLAYVTQVLVPTLVPGDAVMMDNLGATLLYLPP